MKARFEELHCAKIGKGVNGKLSRPIPFDHFDDVWFILEDENNPPTVGRFEFEEFEAYGHNGRSRAKVGKLECVGEIFHIA